MRIDPFFIKRLPKTSPKRVIWTLWARAAEYYSRFFFEEHQIPWKALEGPLPVPPQADWGDTQVQPEQAVCLLAGLSATEGVAGCVVEVGSWKGVSTAYLARATKESVIAIDPFIGPKNEENLERFRDRTKTFPNVRLIRKAFGAAATGWQYGPARFIFIDGTHDYANVSHDLACARRIVAAGGIIAFHDTDEPAFSGCRRAVYEELEQFEIFAHIRNLVLLKVR